MIQTLSAIAIILAGLYAVESAVTYNSHVLHPVHGDIVYAGQPYNVTWLVDSSFTTLSLVVFNVNWYIAYDIPNSGSHIWNVEPIWASGSEFWMILNRADWNTNNEVSPFTIVSLEDQLAAGSSVTPANSPTGDIVTTLASTLTIITTAIRSVSTVMITTTVTVSLPSVQSNSLAPSSIGGIVGGILGGLALLGGILFWFLWQIRKSVRPRALTIPEIRRVNNDGSP